MNALAAKVLLWFFTTVVVTVASAAVVGGIVLLFSGLINKSWWDCTFGLFMLCGVIVWAKT